jgi:hypothetical protein
VTQLNPPAYPKLLIVPFFVEKIKRNDMLRPMRRYHIWLLIAALWFLSAVVTALRQGWRHAWLQALIALAFLCIGIYTRSREQIR